MVLYVLFNDEEGGFGLGIGRSEGKMERGKVLMRTFFEITSFSKHFPFIGLDSMVTKMDDKLSILDIFLYFFILLSFLKVFILAAY